VLDLILLKARRSDLECALRSTFALHK
jgi:hypothetical protein